ncbi:Hsp20/alpha crystallin family protein, partial [Mycobacterium tuberculosis]|nr:Hsp20/alpha crystallin family protein [Mycobacterium tuberculosis]
MAESDKGLEMTAELPGVDPKDINLDIADGMLTLKATTEASKEEKDDNKHYHLVERSCGTFMRRFALPFVPDM